MKKVKNWNKVLIILIICTLAFIWGNSLMPDYISEAISGTVRRVINFIVGTTTGGNGLSGDHILRKLAHGTEYAVLGAELTGWLWIIHRQKLERVIFFGLCTAVLDETIQLFVPGRAGQIKDVWIDMTGLVIGLIIIFITDKIHLNHSYTENSTK